jgi:hypothetical protein
VNRALVVVLVASSSHAVADPDPCSAAALKLKAKELIAWKVPERCTPKGGERAILRTKAELDAAFQCEKGVSLGIDPAKLALVRVPWTMSPAAAGLIAFDDGKLITLVTKFRQPCPNDPHAMPIGIVSYYLLPAGGADRGFAEANCTLAKHCP